MATHGDTLWTIGHSTREWDVFVAMLREAAIEALVDVRRFAGSRRNPQFSGEAMARGVAGRGHRVRADAGARRAPYAAQGFAATPPGATPASAAMPTTWTRRNSPRRASTDGHSRASAAPR